VTPADVRADAFRLPFRDEAFASVLTDPPWHMPYHLRPRFAKELARVLRHGGVLILNAPWALGLTESFRLEAVYYAEPKAWRNCPLVLVYRRI
ncbi:MAG: methyltransferase domain-containing protein, partial [Nitrososphaerota archaeon]